MASTHSTRILTLQSLALTQKDSERRILELKNEQDEVIVRIDENMLPESESHIPIAILECGGLLIGRSVEQLHDLGFTILGKNEKEQYLNRYSAAIQLFNYIITNTDDAFNIVRSEAIKGKEKAKFILNNLTETKEVKSEEVKTTSPISPLVKHFMPKLRKGIVIVTFDSELIPKQSDSYFQVRKKLNNCINLLDDSEDFEELKKDGICINGATCHQQNQHRTYAINILHKCLLKHEDDSITSLLTYDSESLKRYEELKKNTEYHCNFSNENIVYHFSMEDKKLARLHDYYYPYSSLSTKKRCSRLLDCYFLIMNISDMTKLKNKFGIEIYGATSQEQELNRMKILNGLSDELLKYKADGLMPDLIENISKWKIEFKENVDQKLRKIKTTVSRARPTLFVTPLTQFEALRFSAVVTSTQVGTSTSSSTSPAKTLSPTSSTSSSSSSSSSELLPSLSSRR